jgi:glucokinase
MGAYVLAIDIGGTNTKLALVDTDGKTEHVTSIPTSGEKGVTGFLQSVEENARQVINHSGEGMVVGVGIGVAGFVDPDHTKMIFNPNITWLEGVELKDYFTKKINLPVYVEIDSNAAALAEAVHGGGKNSHRLLVLAIGTGLGGGMTVDGQLLRIANECLGDIGHIIVEPGGSQCAAGCRGCAEAMVSASALERYASEYIAEDQNSINFELMKKGKMIQTSEIIQAAKQGDRAAKKAVQKLGMYLGIALASMVPVLAPDQICIAGGISEAGSILLDAANESFRKIAGPPYAKGVTIQKAVLGWQSVLVGSAEAFRRS